MSAEAFISPALATASPRASSAVSRQSARCDVPPSGPSRAGRSSLDSPSFFSGDDSKALFLIRPSFIARQRNVPAMNVAKRTGAVVEVVADQRAAVQASHHVQEMAQMLAAKRQTGGAKARLGGEELEAQLQAFDTSGSPNLLLLGQGLNDDGASQIASLLEDRIAKNGGRSACAMLNLSVNDIEHAGFAKLAAMIAKDADMGLLMLSHNNIGPDARDALVAMIEANRSLDGIDFSHNPLGDDAVAALLRAAVASPAPLRVMMLSKTDITDIAAEALADAIKAAPTAPERPHLDYLTPAGTEFDLRDNRITARGATALGAALVESPWGDTVTVLDLAGNPIGDEGACAVASVQRKWKRFQRLDLQSASIGDAGAQCIADALKEKSSTKQVILSSNAIGDEGAVALAEALRTNSSLTKLDLRYNLVSEKGALALAEAVRVSPSLEWLELNHNDRMTATGARALMDAAEANRRVSVIGVKKFLTPARR